MSKKTSAKKTTQPRIKTQLEKWRPLEPADGVGQAAKGMRHDEERGLYYLASEVDLELGYLLAELKGLGWSDTREPFREPVG